MMFSDTPMVVAGALAVSRVHQHPGHRSGPSAGVDDPHAVVRQVDGAEDG